MHATVDCVQIAVDRRLLEAWPSCVTWRAGLLPDPVPSVLLVAHKRVDRRTETEDFGSNRPTFGACRQS